LQAQLDQSRQRAPASRSRGTDRGRSS
jgi:hypothetical protein